MSLATTVLSNGEQSSEEYEQMIIDEKYLKEQSYIVDFNMIRNKTFIKPVCINNCSVTPYFDGIEDHLVSHINSSSYIIGCVAWLTNRTILDSLMTIKGVKIIVNKEEYLSSKTYIGKKSYNKCMHNKYDSIPDLTEDKTVRQKFHDILNKTINEKDIKNKDGAILTYGTVNINSRMHHKFLIFFDDNFEPIGVWTGSYNISKNSNMSLENVVFISGSEISKYYIQEFMTIYKYSEPYDWTKGTRISKLH